MSGILVIKCPHCMAEQIAMDIVHRGKTRRGDGIVVAICPSCTLPVSAVLTARTSRELIVSRLVGGQGRDVVRDLGLDLAEIFPEAKSSAAPDHVPDAVARVFKQARDSHSRKQHDLASMGYRKALDIALKIFDPAVGGQMNARINALADRNALTPAMKDWAHHVRLLGNEGAHEVDEPAQEDVDDLEAFTESVLEYLFTLPRRVELRRARTESS